MIPNSSPRIGFCLLALALLFGANACGTPSERPSERAPDADAGSDDATTGHDADATDLESVPDLDSDTSESGPCEWTPYPSNPIIEAGWETAGDLLSNDPCVLREGDHLRMWYSQGPGVGMNHVRVYSGTSADGISWDLEPTPLVEPNSDVTVSGAAELSGVYRLKGEDLVDYVNQQPAYTLSGGIWTLWFDPSAGQYRLSDELGGDGSASWLGTGGTVVDGTFTPHTGTAAGEPVVTSDWDSKYIETPSVVHVGGLYHLYYSGSKIGGAPGAYDIGHATSTDGAVWVKDPTNPVVRRHDDPMAWGYYSTAEPAIVVDPTDGTFYLYYTTFRYRGPGYEGTDFTAQQGVALATSTDGSTFTPHEQAVLTQSDDYPVEDLVVGYSTPFALIDSTGKFHLFYDVAYYPEPGQWKQMALAHAVSDTPEGFVEIETDIFTAGDGWLAEEVRAPSVIEEDGHFRMWFSGNNSLFFQPGFVWGIGYAESNRVCRP